MERLVFAFEADSHAGNQLGLLAPGVEIVGPDDPDDYFEPALSIYQEQLWSWRIGWIQEARKFAGKDKLYHAHVGDMTDGRKYQNMKITTSIHGQAAIAQANMMPWHTIAGVEKSVIVTGTGSHAFTDASSEVIVAELMKAKQLPVELVHHALVDVGHGESIDLAHHGPSKGIRKWTEGNQLRYYLKSLIVGDMMEGRKPPVLHVRAHFHDWWLERVTIDEHTEGTIILLPSLCGMGEYARQATGSKHVLTNGVVLVEFIDGQPGRIKSLLERIDLRTIVKVKL